MPILWEADGDGRVGDAGRLLKSVCSKFKVKGRNLWLACEDGRPLGDDTSLGNGFVLRLCRGGAPQSPTSVVDEPAVARQPPLLVLSPSGSASLVCESDDLMGRVATFMPAVWAVSLPCVSKRFLDSASARRRR